jgi:hypothetical protein
MVLASATAATVHQIFGEAALRLAHNNVTDLWFSMKREAACNVRHKLWLIANRFIACPKTLPIAPRVERDMQPQRF